jgi:N utilization substance protein B|tara:strand:+ start:341 stop:775 length:435 start_codon:yes stop_codon:yes gene_type:complete
MDNKLKSKTRLAAIQLVSQQLINKQDIEKIKDDFDKYYNNTKIDKSSEKIEYNISFLSKLVSYYKKIDVKNVSQEINSLITFDRKFEKWDTVNKAILLVAISELNNSKNIKYKIILNDYLEISKSFVNLKDTKIINAILDKFIK